jgi:hypothetical protein
MTNPPLYPIRLLAVILALDQIDYHFFELIWILSDIKAKRYQGQMWQEILERKLPDL